MLRTLLLLVAVALLAGCSGGETADSEPSASPAPPPESTPPPALHAPTEEEIAAAREAGKVRLVLDTEKGPIELELDGEAAPIAVANFLNLVEVGFYTAMPFHRVEPGFVIQAGDPSRAGHPPVGYTIRDEVSPLRHVRGTLAMARLYRGNVMSPNSASTQFYICLGDAPHLDSMGFTAFGSVIEGLDVIDRIAVGDKILQARVLPQTEGDAT